ncbi:CPBP family glutamic-type intramembrane protease [Devosia sp. A8/3-2]|nr:CPBP family glutamic-type intramembrane protease [Devosia sp. A8/3-2]
MASVSNPRGAVPRTMLTPAQLALVLHALALIAVLLALVPLLTSALGTTGYLVVFALYWIGFCSPVIAIHALSGARSPRLFSEKLARRDWFVPGLLLVQVVVIAAVALAPNTSLLTTPGLLLAAFFAIINGPLEETARRGGFMARFADRPELGFWLGWLLFSARHIPLSLSHGVLFDGGAIGPVVSASLLGLLWNWIAPAHGLGVLGGPGPCPHQFQLVPDPVLTAAASSEFQDSAAAELIRLRTPLRSAAKCLYVRPSVTTSTARSIYWPPIPYFCCRATASAPKSWSRSKS